MAWSILSKQWKGVRIVDNLINDLTYHRLVLEKIGAQIEACKERESELLRGIGVVRQLPQELETCIFSRRFLEMAMLMMQENPDRCRFLARILLPEFLGTADSQRGR
jgi:hypothetical protein